MSKRYLSLIIFLLLLINFGNIFPQGKIFFDVKTKFSEKAELTHIKNALEYRLLNSDWANVTEFGEEFALWLVNYHKTQDDNVSTTELDIEIRKPSLFSEGKLVDEEHIEVRYVVDVDNRRVDTHWQLFRQKFGNISDELVTEATDVSERIYDAVYKVSYSLGR